MKTTVKTLALASILVLTTGCSATKGEKRVLTGTAIGAGAGALIGSASGNAGTGALIGAGAGAAGGYLYHKDRR
tara:strand:+ start:57169 stop:57390 length:222 start_codon:yes stop_codon:yes gene_type:complete